MSKSMLFAISELGRDKWNAVCTHLKQHFQMVFCYPLLIIRLKLEEKIATYFLLKSNEQNGLQEEKRAT